MIQTTQDKPKPAEGVIVPMRTAALQTYDSAALREFITLLARGAARNDYEKANQSEGI